MKVNGRFRWYRWYIVDGAFLYGVTDRTIRKLRTDMLTVERIWAKMQQPGDFGYVHGHKDRIAVVTIKTSCAMCKVGQVEGWSHYHLTP